MLRPEDDIGIPGGTLLRRLWNQRRTLERARDKLPWWSWRKRAMLTGAIRAYMIEWESAQVVLMGHVPTDDVRARFEMECG